MNKDEPTSLQVSVSSVTVRFLKANLWPFRWFLASLLCLYICSHYNTAQMNVPLRKYVCSKQRS